MEAARELGLFREAVQELCELAKKIDTEEIKIHLAIISQLAMDMNLTRHLFDVHCDEQKARISEEAEKYADERRREFFSKRNCTEISEDDPDEEYVGIV